jgi:DinB superfamily
MTTQKELYKAKLTAARQELFDLLQTLPPAQWEQAVFSENSTWTVNAIVSHLLEAERGMSIQVHKTRKGEPTIPEGFDLERWNAGTQKRMGQLSPAELLTALVTTRAKTLEVLDSLRDEEWALQGRHPSRGLITIEQYYETIAAHDQMHMQDIRAALQ